MLFVSQEERRGGRVNDMVLFTTENNDITNQSIDVSFCTSEKKNGMTNQLACLARRDHFRLDAFWRVNRGMNIIKCTMRL